MFGRFLKACRNFSFWTLPPVPDMAALAAAWSWPTVASEAPQDLQVTIEELVAFSGAAKSLAPHTAQASIFGEFIGERSRRNREINIQKFSSGESVSWIRQSPTRNQ